MKADRINKRGRPSLWPKGVRRESWNLKGSKEKISTKSLNELINLKIFEKTYVNKVYIDTKDNQ